MSAVAEQLKNSTHLLRALEGATNWRAFAAIVAAFLASLALSALGALTGVGIVIGFMTLVSLLVMLVGVSAAGFMLMDQAKGLPVRSFGEALMASLFSLHRLLGIFLLEILIFAGLEILIAILLFVCKIPAIGPILYAIVFPLSALILGVASVALFYVGFALLAPAVWEGNGIVAAVARLWTIVRKRLLMVIVNLLLLGLITGIAGLVVGGVVFSGSFSVGLMSARILNTGGGMMGGLGMESMMALMGEGAGYMKAAMFGEGVLMMLAGAVPALIALMGSCLIYLQASEGLDFSAAEAELNKKMEDAKRRAEEARQPAPQAAPMAPEAEQTLPPTPAPVAAAHTCPKCGAPAEADDLFCGACGNKLK